MPRGKPTLQTIANLAGVSRATASLAMRNLECVNAKTKQRVQEVAQEIGYVMNPFAVGLNRSKQNNRAREIRASIACIVGHAGANFLSPAYLKKSPEGSYRLHQTYRAITEHAQTLGYAIDAFWAYSPQNRGKRLDTILEARGIQGLLLLEISEEEIDLNWDRYACIYPYGPSRSKSFSFCAEDHFENALTSLEQIRQLGYQKPALALPQNVQNRPMAQSTYGAYLYHHCRDNLNASEQIPPFFWTRNNDLEKLRSWLQNYKPDIILSDFAYKGKGYCHRLCLQLGIRVPEDLGIAYLSTSDLGATGMKNLYSEMGQRSVDLLCQKLHHHNYGKDQVPESLILSAKWVEGNTTQKSR